MRVSNSAFKALHRQNPTDAERVMWEAVKDRQLGGYKFTRQMTIGPYTVDFVCRRKRLVVEIDGEGHETSVTDAGRTCWLNQNGYNILRFANKQVLTERFEVLNMLRAAVEGESLASDVNYSGALPNERVR